MLDEGDPRKKDRSWDAGAEGCPAPSTIKSTADFRLRDSAMASRTTDGPHEPEKETGHRIASHNLQVCFICRGAHLRHGVLNSGRARGRAPDKHRSFTTTSTTTETKVGLCSCSSNRFLGVKFTSSTPSASHVTGTTFSHSLALHPPCTYCNPFGCFSPSFLANPGPLGRTRCRREGALVIEPTTFWSSEVLALLTGAFRSTSPLVTLVVWSS